VSLVERALAGGVLTVTLNDPERRNALSRALTTELVAVLDDADANPAVRVVVLTNAGTTFCAGADLSERSDSTTPVSTIDPTALFGRFARSPKVYVGRLAGHCVAGGVGLAAGLDISVAQTSAKFGFTEVRVGVSPAMISVVCLPKMRLGDAREAFLRGARFSASQAASLGLITRAVADEDLDGEVHAVVTDVLRGGPEALAATKELLARVPQMPTEEAFLYTAQLSSRLFGSPEAREGMTAFLEKRRASWVPEDLTP
jgi:methylglutaconyl-CoA hydratase